VSERNTLTGCKLDGTPYLYGRAYATVLGLFVVCRL